jgi:hypothetical protein
MRITFIALNSAKPTIKRKKTKNRKANFEESASIEYHGAGGRHQRLLVFLLHRLQLHLGIHMRLMQGHAMLLLQRGHQRGVFVCGRMQLLLGRIELLLEGSE